MSLGVNGLNDYFKKNNENKNKKNVRKVCAQSAASERFKALLFSQCVRSWGESQVCVRVCVCADGESHKSPCVGRGNLDSYKGSTIRNNGMVRSQEIPLVLQSTGWVFFFLKRLSGGLCRPPVDRMKKRIECICLDNGMDG